jgi:hypothetical protein
MSALFLRHEGFLGAVGAFLKVHPMHVPTASSVAAGHARAAAAGAAGGDGVARQDSRVLHESASTKVCGACLAKLFQYVRQRVWLVLCRVTMHRACSPVEYPAGGLPYCTVKVMPQLCLCPLSLVTLMAKA